ncbi:MAG: hypothetical protein ACXWXL_03250 [Candidatus Binatia bacterium]
MNTINERGAGNEEAPPLGDFKFTECGECVECIRQLLCPSCECGEFFTSGGDKSELNFDEESTEDFEFPNDYWMDDEEHF